MIKSTEAWCGSGSMKVRQGMHGIFYCTVLFQCIDHNHNQDVMHKKMMWTLDALLVCLHAVFSTPCFCDVCYTHVRKCTGEI